MGLLDNRYFKTRAFTLVELLVVISILGLLVGLAVPAVQSARNKADDAGCQSNLRQIFLATQSAAADNGGNYVALKVFPWDPNGKLNYKAGEGWGAQPEPASIGEVLGPYMNLGEVKTADVDPAKIPKVFCCPAAQKNKKNDWIKKYAQVRYNGYATGRSFPPFGTSRAMLLMDVCWGDWPEENWSHRNPAHVNVAYADGSIRSMSYQEFMRTNGESNAEYQKGFFMAGWVE